jgi:hypothetical protein
VDYFPLLGDETTETLVIAYDRDRYLSNAAKDFIKLAQVVLGSDGGP